MPTGITHVLFEQTGRLYSVIASAPNAPAIAEATAITIFRIISHTDFLIAIVSHLLSCSLFE